MAQIDREDETQNERDATEKAYLRKMLSNARKMLAVDPKLKTTLGREDLSASESSGLAYSSPEGKISISSKLPKEGPLTGLVTAHEVQHQNQFQNPEETSLRFKGDNQFHSPGDLGDLMYRTPIVDKSIPTSALTERLRDTRIKNLESQVKQSGATGFNPREVEEMHKRNVPANKKNWWAE